MLIIIYKNELIESICEDLNIVCKKTKNSFVYSEKGGELRTEILQQFNEQCQRALPHVCGFSATPWGKLSKDVAAMILSMEQRRSQP